MLRIFRRPTPEPPKQTGEPTAPGPAVSVSVPPPVHQTQTMYSAIPSGVNRKRRNEIRINPWLVLLVLLAAFWGGGSYYLRIHPDALAPEHLEQLSALKDRAGELIEEAKLRLAGDGAEETTAKPGQQNGREKTSSTKRVAKSIKPAAPLTNQHRLYLTNGDWVTGELVRETPEEVILRWDYGDVSFSRKEILRLVKEGAPPPAPKPNPTNGAAVIRNPATLHLTNGGIVTGELVHDMPEQVILRFEYGEVVFPRHEIKQVEKSGEVSAPAAISMPWEGEHKKIDWPHQHDVVIRLMNGQIIDAAITSVTPESVMLTHSLEGGGQAEQPIARADIDQLMFKPIRNERSTQIEENLKTLFPNMHWYEEGMFTIVTDSIPPTVKEYRRTIRDLATDWYLTFHPLITGRAPMVHQYVVIFENWDSYIEYAATDGIPGWLAVGYFHPEEQVLYCFNMLGERFSDFLYDVFLGQLREARDRVENQLKGSQVELSVEGQLSEFLQKFETAHAMVRQLYGQLGMSILRHELTHAMFHNWQLQGIRLSQMSEQNKTELEQKREYLKSGDIEQKRKLLEELLKQESATQLPDLRAANSWFVEGLAGYMEPTPVGTPNLMRLAELQAARANQHVLPLEFLSVFGLGSFTGMSNQSMLDAYAQSWALCHFLMQRYPQGFLAYLQRLAREQPKPGEDTLPWLMEALGKEQRALEQEFLAYLDAFPKEDPMWLKQMQLFLDLRAELISLAQRLWSR